MRDLKVKETHCEDEFDSALKEYQKLSEKSEEVNQNALWEERLKHRDSMTKDAKEKMQGHFGKAVRPDQMRRAETDVMESLPNYERSLWRYYEQKRRKERETIRQQQGRKLKNENTRDNVKSREKRKKSDGSISNDADIV